jgi:hypothetical protein
VNWRIWRVATDPRIKDSLTEILENWNVVRLFEAHDVLNALDEAERKARQKTEG